jgi:hypothetical protein
LFFSQLNTCFGFIFVQVFLAGHVICSEQVAALYSLFPLSFIHSFRKNKLMNMQKDNPKNSGGCATVVNNLAVGWEEI